MRFFSHVRSTLTSIFRRNALAAQLDEELRFHLDARTADLIHQGLRREEAARRARLELGSANTHRDEARRSLGLLWFDDLVADLRYGTRILRKNLAFAAIAVGSLALAIGANTAIFSAANEALYERLGIPNPQQLRLFQLHGDKNVVVHSSWGAWDTLSDGETIFSSFSYPVYLHLRHDNTVMQEIFAFKDLNNANVTIDGNAQPARIELVSGNFYQQMEVHPTLGRAILSSDDGAPSTGAVAVISDGLWARAFGRAPNVIGKVISVNATPVTIIGVNPPGFTSARSVQSSSELFMPLSMMPLLHGESSNTPIFSSTELWWLNVMARIKPHVSDQQAAASLQIALNSAIKDTMSPKAHDTIPRLGLVDGSRGLNFSNKRYAQPLYVLIGLVALVLLLACANVANLMLARTLARQREMSVRLALGAARSRILRQVLTEGILLSAIGGIFGLLFGYLGRTALPRLVADSWETTDINVPFNWKIFCFTAAVTIFCGILFAALPAWAAMRSDLNSGLKEGSATSTCRRRAISGRMIVAFQIALSTLLLFSAGLFIRTLLNIDSIDPGFRADHLLLFDINPPSLRYPAPQDVALHAHIEEALRSVLGVRGITLTSVALIDNSRSSSGIHIEGAPEVHRDRYDFSGNSAMAAVGADFLEVMRIPLIAGRAFSREDVDDTSRHFTVINQTFARKYFPDQNPIGKRFSLNTREPRVWYEIVGICGDIRYSNLRTPPPALHFDLYRQQKEIGGVTYIVHTSMPPEAIAPSLRAAVQKIDRDLPLINIRTQQQQIDSTTHQERVFASLTVGFGILALALACVGIYGIMTYTVTQRTSEIGIHLALGAQRSCVRAMVLRESVWLTILGVIVGLTAALALSRLVKSMLYGLSPTDPFSLTAAGLLLLVIAITAAWIPAARASRIEPMEALRHE